MDPQCVFQYSNRKASLTVKTGLQIKALTSEMGHFYSWRITLIYLLFFVFAFFFIMRVYMLIVEDLQTMEKHKKTEKQNPALMTSSGGHHG